MSGRCTRCEGARNKLEGEKETEKKQRTETRKSEDKVKAAVRRRQCVSQSVSQSHGDGQKEVQSQRGGHTAASLHTVSP